LKQKNVKLLAKQYGKIKKINAQQNYEFIITYAKRFVSQTHSSGAYPYYFF
jgi:hypothetical protein